MCQGFMTNGIVSGVCEGNLYGESSYELSTSASLGIVRRYYSHTIVTCSSIPERNDLSSCYAFTASGHDARIVSLMNKLPPFR